MRRCVSILAALALAACAAEDRSGRGQAAREAAALRLSPKEVNSADLQRVAGDAQARRFYQAVGWRAVWSKDAAESLLAALGDAPRHGLSARIFLKVDPESAPEVKEAALTRAALDYGRALAAGFVDPARISEIYDLPRPNPDTVAGLVRALREGNVADWLSSLPPQTDEYRALSNAYTRHSRQAAVEQGTAVASGELIRPGDRDPRIPRLAEALQGNGYLAGGEPAASKDPQQYTPELVDAVRKLQTDYAIDTDGIVGPDTLEVLNTSAADKARQLAVNLERLRWMERQPPATRIDVNTAAAELRYWRDGRLRDRRRVVVGQPDWETPQMQSPMFQLVANPTWTVPDSIEKEELADKGPGYFARNNMVRRNGRIVQLPGPKNALGMVKFDLKNDYAIYLHDTPAKALFEQNERHRSHGCVRVFDALGFAEMLASEQGVAAEFHRELAGGDEDFVALRREIPVRLFYQTAYLDPSGAIRFVTDAYGWDDVVASALSLGSRPRRTLRSRVEDVGP